MEFSILPKGFNIVRSQMPGQNGADPVDVVRLTIIDATGIPVHVTFGAKDFENFQRYIADPEAESAAAEARARLVVPKGPVPPGARGKLH